MEQTLATKDQSQNDFQGQLIELVSPALKFAVRLTGSVSQAEDLIQEAILRAIDRQAQWRGEGSIKTWFFQIIVNTYYSQLRETRSSSALTGNEPGELLEPIDRYLASELGEQIAKAVSTLPKMQREVLIMLTYEDFSVAETAQILNISAQNVYSHLHEARKRLKQQLQPYLNRD